MRCAYCGNIYLNEAPRCDGCGSPRSMRLPTEYRDADALYAEVGHALITGEPNKSRELLERIIGSPHHKDPRALWTERLFKSCVCLGILYFFPYLILGILFLITPFMVTIYLPYLGLKKFASWIASEAPRR